MSGPVHYFTQSSAFRFSRINVNGVGLPSGNNPYLLRENLNVALGTMGPAYYANPINNAPCNPNADLVTGCNYSLDTILIVTTQPTTYPPCITAIMGAGWPSTFQTAIASQPTFLLQFLELLNLVENSSQTYGPFCTTEAYELHVIFNGNIDVSWGALVNVSGSNRRQTPWPLSFPNSITSFELTVYDPLAKAWFQTEPQLYFSDLVS